MKPWHSMTIEEAHSSLGSDPGGMSTPQAAARLAEHGPNRIESSSRPQLWKIFASQFKEYLTLVLIFAAIISVIAGENTNAYVILAIVLLVAVIGFLQEYKAERAMEALRDMVAPEADTLRDGRRVSLPAADLVPGDVIFLEAGDRVPADGRVVEEISLEVVEAALTGESMPVGKDTAPLPEETPLADRRNSVFMGTIVSYGNAKVLVTATGSRTELGRISGLIEQSEPEPPLKMKLAQLAKRQAFLVLAVSVIVFALAVARGSPIVETLITAIALAVAGVPEALPFVVTLALAFGTQAMARRNAIIRRLPTVETLGSTTVICTDKTGTLTTGEMTVREIRTHRRLQVTGSGYKPEGEFLHQGRKVNLRSGPKSDGEDKRSGGEEKAKDENADLAILLKIAVLCNNADIEQSGGRWRVIGDPTEGALIVAAKKAGILEEVRNGFVEVLEYPFDSDRKRMTTLNRSPEEGLVVASKGAPEVILDRCTCIMGSGGMWPLRDSDRRNILAEADAMAGNAMRVLAFAWKPVGEHEPLEVSHLESELIFIGLCGMMDPPRKEAVSALEICKHAGIRPVMITGDHRLTAGAIARELGIGNGEVMEGWQIEELSGSSLKDHIQKVSVFARVTAEHKVRIVEALKADGHIVAMTGDGVNDAPALKAADIGVAMGRTGTEVAKEASDMVITDDNFATIVDAVEEGRRIYDNIRKGASYLLSVSFAELSTIFLGVALGFPVPLLAVQILWINVVAEEFPAIGLSVEPAHPGIMHKRPRDPKETMPSRGLLIYTLGVAAAIVAGTLSLYALALQAGQGLEYSRTVAFMGLGFFTVFNAYSSRSLEEPVWRMNPAGNRMLLMGMGASALALLAVAYVPFMQSIFGTRALHPESWGFILAASLLVAAASEILKKTVPRLGLGP